MVNGGVIKYTVYHDNRKSKSIANPARSFYQEGVRLFLCKKLLNRSHFYAILFRYTARFNKVSKVCEEILLRRILIIVLGLILILCTESCVKIANKIEDDTTLIKPHQANLTTSVKQEEQTIYYDWDFYDKRAEEFVTAMVNGNFKVATDMFDTDMKQIMPISVLENDVWNSIIAQAGAFITIHEKGRDVLDGHHVCIITSRHENKGVRLRIIFSENGLVSGLFIDNYVTLEVFTDFPIVIGEGTDFPLDGLLSIPYNVTGKIPAVVLVHDYGRRDMNETLNRNAPFLYMTHYLASHGIAVIRYHKRTWTHSEKMIEKFGGSYTVKEETIEDVILATEILKENPRIDENKIFILGYGLGGMLAPRIFTEEGGNYAGIISLAGPTRILFEVIYDRQMSYIEAMPEGDEKRAMLAQMETYDEHVKDLMSISDEQAKNTPWSDDTSGISLYYYKEMNDHPVSEYAKDIKIPFLILQGDKDFQTYADKDFIIWQKLLAGRTNVTFKLYEGLNHRFIKSTSKNITEEDKLLVENYDELHQIETQVLMDITQWIKAN